MSRPSLAIAWTFPLLLVVWFTWDTSVLVGATVDDKANTSTSYSPWDDVSWAVWDVKLASADKQALYDSHVAKCREAAGDKDRADAHCYVDGKEHGSHV